MLNEVRIIAGKWRGRKIQFPTVTGSGALGFESLSRGAAHVLCLEKDRDAYQMLRTNAERLNADALEIQEKDALVWLNTQSQQAFSLT